MSKIAAKSNFVFEKKKSIINLYDLMIYFTSICGIIKNIAENGVDKKMFETVKATLLEQNSATLQKFKRCSAASNYQNWFHGMEFVDYKNVMNYIRDMTYEEFNKEIRRVYAQANVSLVCQGNFDSRKLYNLVEIEKMFVQ